MAYKVVFKPSAAKELGRLPKDALKRVDARLLELRSEPRPRDATKLSGLEDLYRVRVGDYRVVYRIEDDRLIVLVVRVRHRREAYR